MKQYLKDIETMDGTWEEDLKVVIEKANPNLEQDFNQIMMVLPAEFIPYFLQWIIDTNNQDLLIKNIDTIMKSIINYSGRIKTWIEKTLILLADIKDVNIDTNISSSFIQLIKGPYKRGDLYTIFDLCKRCRDIGNTREIIEQNYGEILETVFSDNEFLSTNEEELSKIKDLISKIAQQEKVRLSDITRIGSGQYSECLKIGGSVLKFGKKRILEEIPTHKRILKHTLRRNIPNDYKEEIELGNLKEEDVLALECQDLVDVEWYKGLSSDEIEEKLYRIYKELRSSNIIWIDIKAENIGKLIKPNVVEYTVKNSVGQDAIRQISLAAGELVVFDTDRIYTKENLPQFRENYFYQNSLYKKFEERFGNERNSYLEL